MAKSPAVIFAEPDCVNFRMIETFHDIGRLLSIHVLELSPMITTEIIAKGCVKFTQWYSLNRILAT